MKKNGFTLIELLAVIVILAIIALIATPIITSLIEDTRKGAFENTAYGLIKAGELSYTQDLLDENVEQVVFTYENGVETSEPAGKTLKYNGSKPESGKIIVNNQGKVSIAVYNGRYCVEKGFEDSEVVLSEKAKAECTLIVGPVATPEEYFTFDSATGTITDYSLAGPKDVIVPSTIGGVNVTIIGESAFQSKGLTSIKLPEGITRVNTFAFMYNSLTEIEFPSTVNYIGNSVVYFSDVPTVTKLVLPNVDGSQMTLLFQAFYGMYKFNDVTIGSNYTIDSFMFGTASFVTFYNNNGKLAGRYTTSDGTNWVYSSI